MGDGRVNRAIEQGKVRTSEIKERVRAFWELEGLAAAAPVAAPAHDVTLIHQVLLAHELEQARFARSDSGSSATAA